MTPSAGSCRRSEKGSRTFEVQFAPTLVAGTKAFVTAAFKNAKDENGAARSPIGVKVMGVDAPASEAKLKLAA